MAPGGAWLHAVSLLLRICRLWRYACWLTPGLKRSFMVKRVALARAQACARAVGPLLRAGAFSLALLLVAACAATKPQPEHPEPPLVTLESVRILRVADGKATLALVLRLANPNPFELAVTDIAADVTLDGRPAASVHRIQIEPVSASGEVKVEISGLVDVAAVVTALMTLGAQLPVEYTVKGIATLRNGVALPFAREGQVPVARFGGAFGMHP